MPNETKSTTADEALREVSQSSQLISQATETTQAFSQQHGLNLAQISLFELSLARSSDSQPATGREAEMKLDSTRLMVMPTALGTRMVVSPFTASKTLTSYSPETKTDRVTGVSWLQFPNSLPGSPSVHVLALSQTAQAPGCIIEAHLPPGGQGKELQFTVLFDPSLDDVLLASRQFIQLQQIHENTGLREGDADSPSAPINLYPASRRHVSPGTYKLQLRVKGETRELVHLKVMPRRFLDSTFDPSPDQVQSPGGRSRKRAICSGDSQLPTSQPAKRVQRARGNKCAVIMGPKKQTDIASNGNPLVKLERQQTANFLGFGKCDQYSLTIRSPIAQNSSTNVFTATHSRLQNLPGRVVVVKVLKNQADNKPQHAAPSLSHAADVWLKETRIHSLLTKSLPPCRRVSASVVGLLASDARFLAMYQEHIPGGSLGSWPNWLTTGTHRFTGTADDARRILVDMAGAISHVHSLGILHNDIKPNNIMYNRDRGAVLIDFGLASMHDEGKNVSLHAGTPWYLPPEFLYDSTRREPSDIFALGVVMLFVLGLLPLPDRLNQANEWTIAHVHGHTRRRCSAQEQQLAADAMKSWLKVIAELRQRVEDMSSSGEVRDHEQMYSAVKDMLDWDADCRITGPGLLQRITAWRDYESSIDSVQKPGLCR